MQFDVKSYSKDYYLDKKYMGSEILDTPDRETFGYMGRREEVLSEDKKLKKNGKKMKKGTVVVTELQMICGRLKKEFKSSDEAKIFLNDKISDIFSKLNIFIDQRDKVPTNKSKRQVGDTKIGKDGIERVWSKTPSGHDWRRVKK